MSENMHETFEAVAYSNGMVYVPYDDENGDAEWAVEWAKVGDTIWHWCQTNPNGYFFVVDEDVCHNCSKSLNPLKKLSLALNVGTKTWPR